MRPDGLALAVAVPAAAVPVAAGGVVAPPHAAAAAVTPTPPRNVRLFSLGVMPTPSP
jgi:hypothetical protein